MIEINRSDILRYLDALVKVAPKDSPICLFDKKYIYGRSRSGSIYIRTINPTPLIGGVDVVRLKGIIGTLGGSMITIGENGTIISGKHKSKLSIISNFELPGVGFLDKFTPKYKVNESMLRKAELFASSQTSDGPYTSVHIVKGKIYSTDRYKIFIGTDKNYSEIDKVNIPAETLNASIPVLTYLDVLEKSVAFLSESSDIIIASPTIEGQYMDMISLYKKYVPDESKLKFVKFVSDCTGVCNRAEYFNSEVVKVDKGNLVASGVHGSFEEKFIELYDHNSCYSRVSQLKLAISCTDKVCILDNGTMIFGAPSIRVIISPISPEAVENKNNA